MDTVAATESRLRRFLLMLLTLGLLGIGVELIALQHYEDGWQLVPIALIATTILVIVWHAVGGGAASAQTLRVLMVVLIATGATGITLHYLGNREFQLESNPELHGWDLMQRILHAKAPPALAPAAMAQLGLLGLVYLYRHPSLEGTVARPSVD
jgi:hypothetical protein